MNKLRIIIPAVFFAACVAFLYANIQEMTLNLCLLKSMLL